MARNRKKRKDAKLGSIYSRKGVWYVRFIVNGKEYRESSRTTDQDVALAFLEKRRGEVVARKVLGSNPRHTTFKTLVDLIERDYTANERRSIATMRGSVAHLRQHLGGVLPSDVTYALLNEYADKRRAGGAKAATVQRELAVFSKMFKLAVREGKVAHRPEFPTIAVNNARKGFITREEFGRLVGHLPLDVAPAVAFLYVTGWRTGEVRNLKWTAIDFAEGVVRIEGDATKNRTPKTFPFAAHEDLRGILEAQREIVLGTQRRLGTMVPWAFPRFDGSQLGSFRKAWDSACKAAGVPGRVPHDMRRSAIRNMELAGISRTLAMQLTGMKTESVYRRYRIVAEAELVEAVKRMATRGSK